MNNDIGNDNDNGSTKRGRRAGDDISERLMGFAIGCLRLVATLPRTAVARHSAGQLTRCSTSGGANYEEARGAESRTDFAHKVLIAAKEIGETVFWLRLIANAPLSGNPSLPGLIQEGRELVRILMASAKTARSRA